ncbi:THUMP-like domain-containing protein [Sciscionella sediminilitoris]|uniref:THUMP-like domain-containing protein n=1 Tax=Sciscionella sediminilitoris TaxID=1445613 RepID=UPI0004DF0EFE|nr:hypothetical protein [Sciscionella sp. SE31]
MAYAFGLADVAYLRSAAGRDAVAALRGLELSAASRIEDAARARRIAGEYAAAALETVLLQRKAAAKFAEPQQWLYTGDALQQATAAPVAAHRAARLGDRPVHDVTCSIGADLASFAPGSLGSDLDEVRLAMARANCPEIPLLRADALAPASRGLAVFADPARRDGAGKRTWRPEDLRPPLDELFAAYPDRDLVVKCAPGLDFDAIGPDREIEIVSLDRQAREACVWGGSLATPGVRRRATVLDSAGGADRLTDADPGDCPVSPARDWLIDPDPAVVRAGLVRQYACRHGLAQLDERIAYLTGDSPPGDARAFRVLEQLPYNEKRLRSALRARRIGRVEILARGVRVDPDVLRGRLKLSGTQGCSVIVTRIGAKPIAYLCQAQ